MRCTAYHVQLKSDFSNEKSMEKVVKAAGLVGINLGEAHFYDFSFFTACGSKCAQFILRRMPEVKFVAIL